uniref:C-type lectin domain-containing protein n=1 Tax=Spermophilus dauricus TaxID=99837 RepID=A0A8C9UX33_SPEDA
MQQAPTLLVQVPTIGQESRFCQPLHKLLALRLRFLGASGLLHLLLSLLPERNYKFQGEGCALERQGIINGTSPCVQLECQSYGNGAHLASILNLKEASVIAEYISGYQRTQPVWIGLHDPQKKQQWQWIDGASYLYRPWSGRSLGGNKHCTEMGYRNNFVTWNKNECSKRQHFLCKYRP